MFDREMTVAELVLAHPVTAGIFQAHAIDFCCGGKVPVEAAAREAGHDPERLIAELDRAIASRDGSDPDGASVGELSTAALIERIVSRHHRTLRSSLPTVQGLAAKVARVHGTKNEKLAEVDALVRELAESLLAHLDEEETSLFPSLIAEAPNPSRARRELGLMHEEHLAVGRLLEELRLAAEDFRPPSWACTSYRTLMSELEAMEADLFRHIHLENHVLMPRFLPADSA